MSEQLHIMQYVGDCTFWGGREQHILDLCSGLVKRGQRVTALLPPNKVLQERFSAFGHGETLILTMRGKARLQALTTLADYIKREKVDVIHAHSTKDVWFAWAASKLAGRGKCVLTRHIITPLKQDFIHKWLFKQLDKIICPSQLVRDELHKQAPWLPQSLSAAVYNGIDTERFLTSTPRSLRQLVDPDESHLLVGYVGRLGPEKGVEYLIRAVKQVFRTEQAIKLVIIGHGEQAYLEQLRTEAAELGDAVVFLPFTTDVPDVMQSIDVLVLPCVWQEVFGLVLCEAMVCAKVVVTTTNGAQREIITDGENGLFIPSADSEALAEVLRKLLCGEIDRRAMGDKARQRVLECFSQESMLDKLLTQYYDLSDKA